MLVDKTFLSDFERGSRRERKGEERKGEEREGVREIMKERKKKIN
jgi:hypothetical protein